MSETTASERAQRLIVALDESAYWVGRSQRCHVPMKSYVDLRYANRAALLAYVERLEACVDAGRDVVDSANADVVFGSDLSTEERQLAELMAALDRPEDGEHGDQV